MGVNRTSQSGRLEPAKTAVANPVPKHEMADQLPKWQAAGDFCQNGRLQQMLCQTVCQIGIANIVPNKIFFSTDFFRLQMTIPYV
jgi:hypothetical protein